MAKCKSGMWRRQSHRNRSTYSLNMICHVASHPSRSSIATDPSSPTTASSPYLPSTARHAPRTTLCLKRHRLGCEMTVGSGGSGQNKVIGECAGSHLPVDLFCHITTKQSLSHRTQLRWLRTLVVSWCLSSRN